MIKEDRQLAYKMGLVSEYKEYIIALNRINKITSDYEVYEDKVMHDKIVECNRIRLIVSNQLHKLSAEIDKYIFKDEVKDMIDAIANKRIRSDTVISLTADIDKVEKALQSRLHRLRKDLGSEGLKGKIQIREREKDDNAKLRKKLRIKRGELYQKRLELIDESISKEIYSLIVSKYDLSEGMDSLMSANNCKYIKDEIINCIKDMAQEENHDISYKRGRELIDYKENSSKRLYKGTWETVLNTKLAVKYLMQDRVVVDNKIYTSENEARTLLIRLGMGMKWVNVGQYVSCDIKELENSEFTKILRKFIGNQELGVLKQLIGNGENSRQAVKRVIGESGYRRVEDFYDHGDLCELLGIDEADVKKVVGRFIDSQPKLEYIDYDALWDQAITVVYTDKQRKTSINYR